MFFSVSRTISHLALFVCAAGCVSQRDGTERKFAPTQERGATNQSESSVSQDELDAAAVAFLRVYERAAYLCDAGEVGEKYFPDVCVDDSSIVAKFNDVAGNGELSARTRYEGIVILTEDLKERLRAFAASLPQ